MSTDALFEPLQLGPITVPNRFVSTAHITRFAEGGLPTERHLRYWEARAKGGVGLIITEYLPVHPAAAQRGDLIHLWKDACRAPLARIADAVRAAGSRLFGQLGHTGGLAFGPVLDPGARALAPSAVANPLTGGPAHAMSKQELDETIAAYRACAARLAAAGFDGVELHATHAQLPEQFLSPLTNQRADAYGGSDENRRRFVREVLEAIRAAVGAKLAVGVRLSGAELVPGGLTVGDTSAIARWLSAEGLADFLNVSISGAPAVPPSYAEPAKHADVAAALRAASGLPVIYAGGVRTPELAAELVAQGKVDAVGMTRATVCDPELPLKVRTGRAAEVRRCISCNEGCYGRMLKGLPIQCALNPLSGNEDRREIARAAVPRRVLVAGGGIAGLEAARVAALRGHRVTLWERGPALGGQLLAAARAPGRQSLADAIPYYLAAFERLRVEVQLGREASVAAIDAAGAEAVIVATGGAPAPPRFSCSAEARVLQARDVLLGATAGRRVVVLAGDGGMEGLSCADLLASQGSEVTLLVPQAALGELAEPSTLAAVVGRLQAQVADIRVLTTITSVDSARVHVARPTGQHAGVIEGVEAVVVALGSVPSRALLAELEASGRPVFSAGQCYAHTSRSIIDCTTDGYTAACAV